MSNRPIVIEGGTILTPDERLSPGRLVIDGGCVVEVGAREQIRLLPGARVIDASELIVTPGFIDPHIHGCGGVDVMEGTYESLNAVSRIIARHGTTSFLPTTVSSPPEVLTSSIEKLGTVLSRAFDGARPVGIHLEGPFISASRRGTHKAAHVAPPDAGLLQQWVQSSRQSIRLVTVAPELEGIDAVLTLAGKSGFKVAMGHSNATFDEAGSAADRGVRYAVHTFNAMRPFSHRDPGIVGQILSNDGIFAEMIADGIHVDPAVVRLFARAKGRAGVLLATDATSATDMPDGYYVLGKDTVSVINGACRDAEGRLAGSTLTQEIAFRNFVNWSGWTMEDALHGLTVNPARALNLAGKGVLEPGADADIAIIDRQFRVMKTLVGGRLVFQRN